MGETDAIKRAFRPQLAGDGDAAIAFDGHGQVHLHALKAPLDRDGARPQQDHAPSAVGARIVGDPRSEFISGSDIQHGLGHCVGLSLDF